MNKTAKALEIIRDNEISMPKQFAHHYFPEEHEGWRRVGRVGHGVTRGVGLVLFAGGFMGKLRAQELISGGHPEYPARLTEKGHQYLKDQINTN